MAIVNHSQQTHKRTNSKQTATKTITRQSQALHSKETTKTIVILNRAVIAKGKKLKTVKATVLKGTVLVDLSQIQKGVMESHLVIPKAKDQTIINRSNSGSQNKSSKNRSNSGSKSNDGSQSRGDEGRR